MCVCVCVCVRERERERERESSACDTFMCLCVRKRGRTGTSPPTGRKHGSMFGVKTQEELRTWGRFALTQESNKGGAQVFCWLGALMGCFPSPFLLNRTEKKMIKKTKHCCAH